MEESGREFESRGLHIARAIHNPRGEQGPIMHAGREHDGLFITDDAIHTYEFTVDRKKAKAQKDAVKMRELLLAVSARQENRYKSLTGWFVTADEPTADQRSAVDEEARRGNVRIHALSIAALSNLMCKSLDYLKARAEAPFGSVSYGMDANRPQRGNRSEIKVEVILTRKSGESLPMDELARMVVGGYRALVTGEFGVGKSHALRELYLRLRKLHLDSKSNSPFPVYINLRDCVGLRSETEVLRRHAEGLSFDADSLIRAWRAGACVLLLDGFDEVSPSRAWLGEAVDLKDVRYAALEPVRRLVDASPMGTGIIACGRSHYFSSETEMANTLGFPVASIIGITNFTDEQVERYLALAGVPWAVPEWLPARPLLLGYLVALEDFRIVDSGQQVDRATAWLKFFDAICVREAKLSSTVRPEVIKAIVTRVATLARAQGHIAGPVNMATMRQAFVDINKRQPDGDGLQLLLRLPGLAISDAGEDARVFVDTSLAETAYGVDLAEYLSKPYLDHPLAVVASWIESATPLGIEVAAALLRDQAVKVSTVMKAASHRQNQAQFDAVLADSLRVVSSLDFVGGLKAQRFIIDGVEFSELNVFSDSAIANTITYQNCVIHLLDISLTEAGQPFPEFIDCLIGYMEGASAVPDWLASHFIRSEISEFSQHSQTTAGIMQLGLGKRDKVALTILKKIYNQPGSGRKESALMRGLDQASRGLVPDVISALVSQRLLQRTTANGNVLYLPVKGQRAAALKALEKPGEFALDAGSGGRR